MSTDLISAKPIVFDDLKNFYFKGVFVDSIPDEDSVILTDGTNYLWAIASSDVLFGKLDEFGKFQIENEHMQGVLFTRYAGNYPEKIIMALEEYYGTKLITEDDNEFIKFLKKGE